MLVRQIERIRRARHIDQLAVATSTDATDDPLEALCDEENVECFRGDLNDVLDRFFRAAAIHSPEYVVRLTGDCPLIDPGLIDLAVDAILDSGADFVSNAVQPTYPDGLDVEVLRFTALTRAWREARKPAEREHVTLYIYQHPESFRLHHVKGTRDLSHMRWTVDTIEDFGFVRSVYESLYRENPVFSTEDILKLLERNPGLANVNRHIRRNEGLEDSLREQNGK
jgi:spore coat polysaccharide biosynthesis protein SpsF